MVHVLEVVAASETGMVVLIIMIIIKADGCAHGAQIGNVCEALWNDDITTEYLNQLLKQTGNTQGFTKLVDIRSVDQWDLKMSSSIAGQFFKVNGCFLQVRGILSGCQSQY